MMETLYLSGGIQYVEDHRAHFERGEAALSGLGFQVVNPLKQHACHEPTHIHPCVDAGSGLPLLGQEKNKHTWRCFMRWDLLAMLEKCDAIALMPGWEASPGARMELHVATSCGLKVYYLTNEFELMEIPA